MKGKEMSIQRNQESTQLLRSYLEKWQALFSRRVDEKAAEVWFLIFGHHEPRRLAKALEIVTEDAERMPAPGSLKKALESARAYVAVAQQGVKNCRCQKCKGTGFELIPQPGFPDRRHAKKCDCHTEHASNIASFPAVDPNGTMCEVDSQTGEYLYRATDCDEGRQALAAIARLARKNDLANWYAGGMKGPHPKGTTSPERSSPVVELVAVGAGIAEDEIPF